MFLNFVQIIHAGLGVVLMFYLRFGVNDKGKYKTAQDGAQMCDCNGRNFSK